jgi:hypothetical protein
MIFGAAENGRRGAATRQRLRVRRVCFACHMALARRKYKRTRRRKICAPASTYARRLLRIALLTPLGKDIDRARHNAARRVACA